MKYLDRKELLAPIFALLISIAFLLLDVIEDLREGADFSHVAIEIVAFICALVGVTFLFRSMFKSFEGRMDRSLEDLEKLKIQAIQYKEESNAFLNGLAKQIDIQFDKWHLTNAEKEIGLLLIKGLSAKEIGEIRSVQEKTIRQQCLSLYKKSGLGGRAELSAYFFEDLLLPSEIKKSDLNDQTCK